ncbi:hypothetical protein [Methylocystis sp. SC2]|uniref:hypothetical protein n=1 Tax=Methylocystis sp. (strain SC2) TaxID=187303 RepID=UPI00027AF3B2|nr:hypothetical protein [Methylocystis sp. SC2]CCJ07222.1 Uncharacterized protein BN69_1771 [Methylocystis sp. SC2]
MVKSWKTFTARRINHARGGAGSLRAPDYFDRYMRDKDDLGDTVAYIENNPVVAGLAARSEARPWSSAAKR